MNTKTKIVIGVVLILIVLAIFSKTQILENYQALPMVPLFTGYDSELLSKSNMLQYPEPGLDSYTPTKTSDLVTYCDEEIGTCITY